MSEYINGILLAERGWKQYTDSYLKSLQKKYLIDYIRILENNWSNEIYGSNLLSQRLKNACDYLRKLNISLEEINKIISVEEEKI